MTAASATTLATIVIQTVPLVSAAAASELGLARLISIIDPRNAASIRVAEKVGMRHERDSLFHATQVRIYAIARGA